MDQDSKIWGQARTINAAQNLLKRRHLRRFVAEGASLTIPSLTPQQVHMIITVRQHGSLTLKLLAAALGVKPPAVSLMLDRLVEAGVLSREQNPSDRREVIIRLTPETEAQFDGIERHVLLATVEVLENLGPKYAQLWCDVCARIQEVLKDEEADVLQGELDT